MQPQSAEVDCESSDRKASGLLNLDCDRLTIAQGLLQLRDKLLQFRGGRIGPSHAYDERCSFWFSPVGFSGRQCGRRLSLLLDLLCACFDTAANTCNRVVDFDSNV